MSAPVLSVDNLTLSFAGASVLEDVSFSVGERECVGLIGPNGAGKTSLLNCISRSYKQDQGIIRFQGSDLARVPAHRIARLGIVRTFQSVELLPRSTVVRNTIIGAHPLMRGTFLEGLLRVGRSPRDEKRFEAEARHTLDQLGLGELADRPVGELPFGSQKLIEVARALLGRPTLLLLDEPIGGTNTEERKVIGNYITRIREQYNLSLIVVEHDIAFVSSIADRIVALDFGRVIADGPAADVLADPKVIESYVGASARSTTDTRVPVADDATSKTGSEPNGSLRRR
jgi:branched-chain amino acid transport system ATP-binding protein